MVSNRYLFLCLFALVGCGGNSTWIEPPEISADAAAEKAMELYDKNSDSFLDGEELEQVPGVRAAMRTVDKDGDSRASAEEIAERIRSWQANKAGLTSILCDLIMDGQPLAEAIVTFEPESFLGEDIKAATGKTTIHGKLSPSIPKENRPSPDSPSGLQLGFYRVRVSKVVNGKETIPSKYNTETILGQQVAGDDPAVINRSIRFILKSR